MSESAPIATSGRQLTLVVLSPEVELLNTHCDFVALPAYDGELGILPGHAPLVAMLGSGELRVRTGNTVARYYVSGGYVQVRNDEVYVLTLRAVDAAKLDKAKLTAELARAEAMPTPTLAAVEERRHAIEAAKTQIAIREKA